MSKQLKTITTPIIPSKTTFIGEKKTLDLKAICVFSALGFFLDDDSYYLEQKVLKPATRYTLDTHHNILAEEPYFKWHYTPEQRSLKVITEEFAALFESIIRKQVEDKRVILPLSGGIDSRTQAAALKHIGAPVHAYSYQFEGGHGETLYAKHIAEVCGFPFQAWTVPQGYLWEHIERLAKLNGCYSEFTHSRQMAFSGLYSGLGDVFSLGHWGDVLFDDMGVPDHLSREEQVAVLLKKMVKKGGMALASSLWKHWQIEGDFKTYFYERIKNLLYKIDITNNANASIRAFKSLYWAPRWTSVNLAVFEQEKPITLPYYSNDMCAFICSVPEAFLAKRQVQIAYLKMRNPDLAKITWEQNRPFNLYNYHWNRAPYNLPYRVFNKTKQILEARKPIQRNWELQFLGRQNEQPLEQYLFNNGRLAPYIPNDLIQNFYNKFKTEDSVFYSHTVSTLLTLSLFFKNKADDSFTL